MLKGVCDCNSSGSVCSSSKPITSEGAPRIHPGGQPLKCLQILKHLLGVISLVVRTGYFDFMIGKIFFLHSFDFYVKLPSFLTLQSFLLFHVS